MAASVKYLPVNSGLISPTPARLINPPLPVSPLPSDTGCPVAGLIGSAEALGAVRLPYNSLPAPIPWPTNELPAPIRAPVIGSLPVIAALTAPVPAAVIAGFISLGIVLFPSALRPVFRAEFCNKVAIS